MAKKPITTVITISRLGIYDAKHRLYYWADWMWENRGLKCYALSDLFSENTIHVFNAMNDAYLGLASVKKMREVIVNNNTRDNIKKAIKDYRRRMPTTSTLLSFCE